MAKMKIPSIFCFAMIIFQPILGETGYTLRLVFKKTVWVDLTVYEHRLKNLLSKLRTVIMNAYNDELTLHSKICQTDVARYSAKLWD